MSKGDGGNGSVEAGRASGGVGTAGGSPEGDRSRCRGRVSRGSAPGVGAAMERGPEAGRGAAAVAGGLAGGVVARGWGGNLPAGIRRDRALAGLELGLKDRHGEPLAAALEVAKRHIGELSMENELLRERARTAEQRLPLPMRRSRR